jgi:hypothetical protein
VGCVFHSRWETGGYGMNLLTLVWWRMQGGLLSHVAVSDPLVSRPEACAKFVVALEALKVACYIDYARYEGREGWSCSCFRL